VFELDLPPLFRSDPIMAKRKSTEDVGLEGCCFALTGTFSVSRQEFEELILQNGGEIAKSVTKKCTHLVR
jgi:NAD-dependent DNA ligase